MELLHSFTETPVGVLLLVASNKGLRRLAWEQEYQAWSKKDWLVRAGNPGKNRHLSQAQKELKAYFLGKLEKFQVALDMQGTDFQIKAWSELAKIPFGQTISYAEQAKRMGDAKKARAVGGANGRNPISIIVPCHRVVGKNGDLTGFALGLRAKKTLLRHERVLI